MDDIFNRFVTDIIGRLTGPLTLRLFRLRGEAVRELLRGGYGKALTLFLADYTLDVVEKEFLRIGEKIRRAEFCAGPR